MRKYCVEMRPFLRRHDTVTILFIWHFGLQQARCGGGDFTADNSRGGKAMCSLDSSQPRRQQFCYEVFTFPVPVSYDEAAYYCSTQLPADRRGTLAIIRNQTEHDAVAALLEARGLHRGLIGLRKARGPWVWLADSTPLRMQGSVKMDHASCGGSIDTPIRMRDATLLPSCITACNGANHKFAAINQETRRCYCSDLTEPCCGDFETLNRQRYREEVYSVESNTFDNWAPGRPLSRAGCVAISRRDRNLWIDSNCTSSLFPFLCQFPASDKANISRQLSHVLKSGGRRRRVGTKLGCFGDFCYWIGADNVKLNFHDAGNFCRSYGGVLAKIGSQSVQTFVERLLTVNNASHHYVWIGAKNVITYQWPDGTGTSLYDNWSVERENSRGDCVKIEIDRQGHYRWVRRPCGRFNNETTFICSCQDNKWDDEDDCSNPRRPVVDDVVDPSTVPAGMATTKDDQSSTSSDDGRTTFSFTSFSSVKGSSASDKWQPYTTTMDPFVTDRTAGFIPNVITTRRKLTSSSVTATTRSSTIETRTTLKQPGTGTTVSKWEERGASTTKSHQIFSTTVEHPQNEKTTTFNGNGDEFTTITRPAFETAKIKSTSFSKISSTAKHASTAIPLRTGTDSFFTVESSTNRILSTQLLTSERARTVSFPSIRVGSTAEMTTHSRSSSSTTKTHLVTGELPGTSSTSSSPSTRSITKHESSTYRPPASSLTSTWKPDVTVTKPTGQEWSPTVSSFSPSRTNLYSESSTVDSDSTKTTVAKGEATKRLTTNRYPNDASTTDDKAVESSTSAVIPNISRVTGRGDDRVSSSKTSASLFTRTSFKPTALTNPSRTSWSTHVSRNLSDWTTTKGMIFTTSSLDTSSTTSKYQVLTTFGRKTTTLGKATQPSQNHQSGSTNEFATSFASLPQDLSTSTPAASGDTSSTITRPGEFASQTKTSSSLHHTWSHEVPKTSRVPTTQNAIINLGAVTTTLLYSSKPDDWEVSTQTQRIPSNTTPKPSYSTDTNGSTFSTVLATKTGTPEGGTNPFTKASTAISSSRSPNTRDSVDRSTVTTTKSNGRITFTTLPSRLTTFKTATLTSDHTSRSGDLSSRLTTTVSATTHSVGHETVENYSTTKFAQAVTSSKMTFSSLGTNGQPEITSQKEHLLSSTLSSFHQTNVTFAFSSSSIAPNSTELYRQTSDISKSSVTTAALFSDRTHVPSNETSTGNWFPGFTEASKLPFTGKTARTTGSMEVSVSSTRQYAGTSTMTPSSSTGNFDDVLTTRGASTPTPGFEDHGTVGYSSTMSGPTILPLVSSTALNAVGSTGATRLNEKTTSGQNSSEKTPEILTEVTSVKSFTPGGDQFTTIAFFNRSSSSFYSSTTTAINLTGSPMVTTSNQKEPKTTPEGTATTVAFGTILDKVTETFSTTVLVSKMTKHSLDSSTPFDSTFSTINMVDGLTTVPKFETKTISDVSTSPNDQTELATHRGLITTTGKDEKGPPRTTDQSFRSHLSFTTAAGMKITSTKKQSELSTENASTTVVYSKTTHFDKVASTEDGMTGSVVASSTTKRFSTEVGKTTDSTTKLPQSSVILSSTSLSTSQLTGNQSMIFTTKSSQFSETPNDVVSSTVAIKMENETSSVSVIGSTSTVGSRGVTTVADTGVTFSPSVSSTDWPTDRGTVSTQSKDFTRQFVTAGTPGIVSDRSDIPVTITTRPSSLSIEETSTDRATGQSLPTTSHAVTIVSTGSSYGEGQTTVPDTNVSKLTSTKDRSQNQDSSTTRKAFNEKGSSTTAKSIILSSLSSLQAGTLSTMSGLTVTGSTSTDRQPEDQTSRASFAGQSGTTVKPVNLTTTNNSSAFVTSTTGYSTGVGETMISSTRPLEPLSNYSTTKEAHRTKDDHFSSSTTIGSYDADRTTNLYPANFKTDTKEPDLTGKVTTSSPKIVTMMQTTSLFVTTITDGAADNVSHSVSSPFPNDPTVSSFTTRPSEFSTTIRNLVSGLESTIMASVRNEMGSSTQPSSVDSSHSTLPSTASTPVLIETVTMPWTRTFPHFVEPTKLSTRQPQDFISKLANLTTSALAKSSSSSRYVATTLVAILVSQTTVVAGQSVPLIPIDGGRQPTVSVTCVDNKGGSCCCDNCAYSTSWIILCLLCAVEFLIIAALTAIMCAKGRQMVRDFDGEMVVGCCVVALRRRFSRKTSPALDDKNDNSQYSSSESDHYEPCRKRLPICNNNNNGHIFGNGYGGNSNQLGIRNPQQPQKVRTRNAMIQTDDLLEEYSSGSGNNSGTPESEITLEDDDEGADGDELQTIQEESEADLARVNATSPVKQIAQKSAPEIDTKFWEARYANDKFESDETDKSTSRCKKPPLDTTEDEPICRKSSSVAVPSDSSSSFARYKSRNKGAGKSDYSSGQSDSSSGETKRKMLELLLANAEQKKQTLSRQASKVSKPSFVRSSSSSSMETSLSTNQQSNSSQSSSRRSSMEAIRKMLLKAPFKPKKISRSLSRLSTASRSVGRKAMKRSTSMMSLERFRRGNKRGPFKPKKLTRNYSQISMVSATSATFMSRSSSMAAIEQVRRKMMKEPFRPVKQRRSSSSLSTSSSNWERPSRASMNAAIEAIRRKMMRVPFRPKKPTRSASVLSMPNELPSQLKSKRTASMVSLENFRKLMKQGPFKPKKAARSLTTLSRADSIASIYSNQSRASTSSYATIADVRKRLMREPFKPKKLIRSQSNMSISSQASGVSNYSSVIDSVRKMMQRMPFKPKLDRRSATSMSSLQNEDTGLAMKTKSATNAAIEMVRRKMQKAPFRPKKLPRSASNLTLVSQASQMSLTGLPMTSQSTRAATLESIRKMLLKAPFKPKKIPRSSSILSLASQASGMRSSRVRTASSISIDSIRKKMRSSPFRPKKKQSSKIVMKKKPKKRRAAFFSHSHDKMLVMGKYRHIDARYCRDLFPKVWECTTPGPHSHQHGQHVHSCAPYEISKQPLPPQEEWTECKDFVFD